MKKNLFLILRMIAAGILLQTLYFKFSGSAESVYIFKTLQMEPWGRWASGFAELLASTLLLVPSTQILGALMAFGVMSGAILSHIFVLGLVIQDDGGLLFVLACTVFIISIVILLKNLAQLKYWLKKLPFLSSYLK